MSTATASRLAPLTKLFGGGLFCLALCLLWPRAYAQSFYYFEYGTNRQPSHVALLTVFPDGSAKARLRYQQPETGKDYLYDLSLTDSSWTEAARANGQEKHLTPVEITPLTGRDAAFEPPVFVFLKKTDSLQVYYVPGEIKYQYNGNWISATLKDQITYPYAMLDEELVSVFYNTGDPFYRDLFKLETRSLSSTDLKTKMHLIVVAGTDDPSIGASSRRDMFNVSGYFAGLAEALGIPIDIKSIWGKNFTRKAVEDAILQLRPAANDIVIFYFSGHGFRNDTLKSKFPILLLNTTYTIPTLPRLSLPAEEIYNRIVKKGARLNLVITDCCNERVDAEPGIGTVPLGTKSAGLPLSIDNCKALFFSPKRTSILATSADVNQLASGNPEIGGYYSWNLRASLESYTSRLKTNVTWLQVLNEARINTARKALGARCWNPKVPCQQHPWFSIK